MVIDSNHYQTVIKLTIHSNYIVSIVHLLSSIFILEKYNGIEIMLLKKLYLIQLPWPSIELKRDFIKWMALEKKAKIDLWRTSPGGARSRRWCRPTKSSVSEKDYLRNTAFHSVRSRKKCMSEVQLDQFGHFLGSWVN